MPNPYVNKVVIGNSTIIDLSSDTVSAEKLKQGETAHSKSGAPIVGTMIGSRGIADKVPEEYEDYAVAAETLLLAQGGSYDYILILENDDYIAIDFINDEFEISTYNTSTTEYTATGFWYAQYDKEEEAWTLYDYTESASLGGSFLRNGVFANTIIEYNDETVFPVAKVSSGLLAKTVIFSSAGETYMVQSVKDGGSVVTPVVPTRAGYNFLGWGTSASASQYITFPYTPVNAQETLHAVWEALPFQFSSSSPFSVEAPEPKWDGTMQVSTDGNTWSAWDGTEVSAVEDDAVYYLYFRGIGNTVVSYVEPWTIDGTSVNCSGNIEFLLDYLTVQNGQHPTMGAGCFAGMFGACTALVSAPALPLVTLSSFCYYTMFAGCTALTVAPDLPATTLDYYCYSSMFAGCTALTVAPDLPATTLSSACYGGMFTNCTSLVTAPNLPAMVLDVYSHAYMFYGCTALVTAPALPATTLALYCYEGMFNGCTALTAAPALPATILSMECYEMMFYGCTSLTTAPDLPATVLDRRCYQMMFTNCTSLTTAPNLPATNLSYNCYEGMFNGCTSLITAPSLPATSVSYYSYTAMFAGCTSLVMPPSLPAAELNSHCYESMFQGCTSLVYVPNLPSTEHYSWCYASMFEGCTSLKVYSESGIGHDKAWRIPTSGEIPRSSDDSRIFYGTIGDYSDTEWVDLNTTFYTQNTPV